MTLLSQAPATREAPSSPTRRTSGHLRSVDVVRVITVAGVISVHSISFTNSRTSPFPGALVSLLHVNREIFLLLSAFVLTYAYGRRPQWKVTSFWRRRYLLVVTPYVCWSAIYCGLNEGPFTSVAQGFERFGYDLISGAASFHLYFLLLSMQLYLVFPLLLKALKALRRHHLALLVVSFAAQVGFTSVFFYWPPSTGILGYWAGHPNTDLLSYQFYVIAGGVAALRWDQLSSWVAAHRRLVTASVGAALALGLTSYFADLRLLGMSVPRASQVFQPLIAVESVAFATGVLCLGQWVEERGSTRILRVASVGSDTSFGVYLAHPLLLDTLLGLLTSAGVLGTIQGAGVIATLAFDVAIVVPVVYATAAAGAWLVRRTPLSLALTGRARQQRPGLPNRIHRLLATRVTPPLGEPAPVGGVAP
ncbi:MAG: acyltransferase [Acidimicrobiales bacterium]